MNNAELMRLQGKWVLVSCEHDGQSVSRNIGQVMRIVDDRMFWPEAGRPAAVRKIAVDAELRPGVLRSELLGIETPDGRIFAPASVTSPSVDMLYELSQHQLRMIHRNDDSTNVIFEFERFASSSE